MKKHTPVLLKEVLENVPIVPGGRYIDATYGEGGYSEAIAALGGRVLAIDLDGSQLPPGGTTDGIKAVRGNFADICGISERNGFTPADGIIFDLGLSMGQLSGKGRGFSFLNDSDPLDMRMDTGSGRTAGEIIRSAKTDELYEIIARNSEDVRARAIAESIKSAGKMATVGDLKRAIDKAVGFSDRGTYSRVFQAFRMETNDEIGNLRKGLEGAVKTVRQDGWIAVISFHSVEDRIVKRLEQTDGYGIKVGKAIVNRRGRSFERIAKLRIIKKT